MHAAVSYFTSTIVNLEQKNKLILLHSIRYKTDKDLSFFLVEITPVKETFFQVEF